MTVLPRTVGLARAAASSVAGLLVLLTLATGVQNSALAQECSTVPSTAGRFLPSSNVPPDATVASSGDVPAYVGDLATVLTDLPGTQHDTVMMMLDSAAYPVDVVRVPAGSMLYRAMTLPTSFSAAPDDVRNLLAADTTWFSNERVANIYARSSWLAAENRVVVGFRTTRPLTLMNLASSTNLAFLWASVANEYKRATDFVTSLTGPNPPTRNPIALEVARQHVKDLRGDLRYIRLTTGYDATWADQLRLLVMYGDAITSEPSRSPQQVLDERRITPADTFIVSTDTPGVWRPATVVTGCPGTSPTEVWGPGRSELNRVSFNAALDRRLANIIDRSMNVDGFYAPAMPSLLNRLGFLLEEVALFTPRGSVELVSTGSPG